MNNQNKWLLLTLYELVTGIVIGYVLTYYNKGILK